MNTLQWKSAFSNNLVPLQGLPFDRPLSSDTTPSSQRFIELEISSLSPSKKNIVSSLFLLLRSYNELNKTNVILSLKNSKNELIPSLLSFDNISTVKDLRDSINDIFDDIENIQSLNDEQLTLSYSEQLDSLSLPASQCTFSHITHNKDLIEKGYLDFYTVNNTTLAASFDCRFFDKISVQRILDDWLHITKQLHQLSDLTDLKNITTLSPTNKKMLDFDWNRTQSQLDSTTNFNEVFEKHSDQHPNKICASDINQTYTYKDLDTEANIIANALIENGVIKGNLIAIALPRSVQMVSSILGIFKSGAAYIPLDPDFPDDRLAYMAEHSKTKILITNESSKDRFSFFSGKIITIESLTSQLNPNKSRPNLEFSLETTAYVIYTSGSTGKPKGVEISQLNLLNLLHSMKKIPGMNPDDSLCAVTTLSFDMSVVELFLPIYCGASVVIADKETSLYADKLIDLMEMFKTNIIQATPATFRLLISQNWQPTINTKVLCGGEPFPIDLAKSLQERAEAVWNVYGPTETTVFSTAHRVRSIQSSVLIGRPIDNTSIYILDDALKPVQIGMPGNLYIGGMGLAKGYLHQSQLTSERFIQHPNNETERIYDTGDIARYTSNGDIECLGRSDGQIKIRGYRIELGEIESCLSQCNGIQSQVVIPREDEPGNQQLVAYYLTDDKTPLNEKELKAQISEKLPKYMVPTRFIHLLSFPMTLNYKIDRKSLPKPSSVHTVSVSNPPSTPLEHKIHNIWCKVLSLNAIDIKESFFDIGGNSLLSIRIFTDIKKQFSIALPLDTLFTYPSIEKIASHLETLLEDRDLKKESISASSNLVNIQPEGIGLPIFFFHGVGGNVLNYIRLVSSIGSERPTFGLQSSGVDGTSTLESSYTGMIETYIKEIKRIQPNGPYTLVGGSMGGVTALDIAISLSKAGDEIADVIMFDSFGPHFNLPDHQSQRSDEPKAPFFHRLIDFTRYRTKRFLSNALPPVYSLLNIPVPYSIRYQMVENNNYKLMAMRQPEKYNDTVTLIRAPMQSNGPYSDENLGWGLTVAELNIYYVEGNHTNMVESPHSMEIFKAILLNKDKKIA